MILTVNGADFSNAHIGETNGYSVLVSGRGSSNTNWVDKGNDLTMSITINANYTYESLEITVGNNPLNSGFDATHSNGTVSLVIPADLITGVVRIKVNATSTNTGSGTTPPVTPDPEPEEPGTGGDISGWTEIPLNTDSSSWIRATVSATGVGTEGSSDKRLTYNKVLDIPTSQRIKVVCDSNYQWGVRNGASESTLGNNQYWLNSGDEVQFAHTPTDGKFMLVFRKNTTYRDPFSQSKDPTDGSQPITKSDVATMQPKLYYKDEYSAEFDVTNYKHVMDLTTSQSDWIRATVGDNGPAAANSSTTRLTYNKKLDASLLQEKDVILITCAAGYQWGVRSSDNGTTFKNNSYWFNSGTCVRFSMSGTSPITNGTATNFYIVFRKAKAYNGIAGSANDDEITFNDINTLNAKVYTAKPY
jgi:hypothetical protein